MRRSVVSFVGAGPGDPELITLKGLRRLREAEVVLHDRLIPTSLLDEVSSSATVIDVGKTPGRPCMGQGQINWLLVDWARRREHVVRLKGGDPAVFGRLSEEIFYAERLFDDKGIRYPFVTGSLRHGHVGQLLLQGPHAAEFADRHQLRIRGDVRFHA